MILEEMTMTEFKRALRKTRTLLVPYGSVEAHGTHLPLNTDTLIIAEAARMAAARAPFFVAPPVHYGVCTSTGQHPGTISISSDTLRSLTLDIVREAHGKGLENFVLISGHGGGLHVAALREAGEMLTREIEGIKIAALSIYEILGPEAAALSETPGDSHAGEMETSAVLHLAPTLVKGRSKEEYPRLPKPIVAREKVRFWPGAVWGDPGKATVEKGRRLLEMMADSIAGLVKRIDKTRV